MSKSQKYQDMYDKVEEIVERIQDDDMPLDDLVGEVEKGYKLIQNMREKLDATRVKIESLRGDMTD